MLCFACFLSWLTSLERIRESFCVTRLEDVDLPPIGANDVLVKMLAAPINPSDINMVQGIIPPHTHTNQNMNKQANKQTTVFVL